MSRQLAPIDPEQVIKLAKLGCTMDEIAEFFDVSRATISGRFRSEFYLGRATVKMRLRKRQLESALKRGSVPMLIHLGKCMLGQTDKSQPLDDLLEDEPATDEDGNPVEP